MQQKKIIIFIVALFVLSSAYLFFVNEKHLKNGKDWWAVYFEEPAGENLDFVIENYTDKTEFEYKILAGEIELKKVNVSIRKGSKEEVFLGQIDFEEKVSIIVSDIESKKMIFKN